MSKYAHARKAEYTLAKCSLWPGPNGQKWWLGWGWKAVYLRFPPASRGGLLALVCKNTVWRTVMSAPVVRCNQMIEHQDPWLHSLSICYVRETLGARWRQCCHDKRWWWWKVEMEMMTRGSCGGKHSRWVVCTQKRRIRKIPGRCGVIYAK